MHVVYTRCIAEERLMQSLYDNEYYSSHEAPGPQSLRWLLSKQEVIMKQDFIFDQDFLPPSLQPCFCNYVYKTQKRDATPCSSARLLTEGILMILAQ